MEHLTQLYQHLLDKQKSPFHNEDTDSHIGIPSSNIVNPCFWCPSGTNTGIWLWSLGVESCPELEKIHRQFRKFALNVLTSATNLGIYGELGRFPLNVKRYTRVIKFWSKLTKCKDWVTSVMWLLHNTTMQIIKMIKKCTKHSEQKWSPLLVGYP